MIHGRSSTKPLLSNFQFIDIIVSQDKEQVNSLHFKVRGKATMTATPDLRNDTRIKHKADIQFENYFSHIHYTARMYNYSLGGMYFETDYAPLPGTEIFIGIKDSPYDSGADVYRAQIRWRRPLPPGGSTFNYGVGVRYCNLDDK